MPPRAAAAETNTARIRGRVVRADTGAPLRGARIMLNGTLVRRTTADDLGRYEFAELPPGRYRLSASQQGAFVTVNYGQQRPDEPGRSFALASAQVLNDVDFALPRVSVIKGRITDESGEPVTGAEIRIERYQYGPGGRWLATFAIGTLGGQLGLITNDLGEFRAFGLTPGEYAAASASHTSSSSEIAPRPIPRTTRNARAPPERPH